MNSSHLPKSGLLLFHSGNVVYADMHAAHLLGFGLDALSRASLDEVLTYFDAESRARIKEAFSTVEGGELPPMLENLCLHGDGISQCLDGLVDFTVYHGRQLLRLVLLSATAAQPKDNQYTHLQRLQILHEIDRAILSSEDEKATAAAALLRLGALIPGFIAGGVVIIDDQDTALTSLQSSPRASILALHPANFADEFPGNIFHVNDLGVDLVALRDGLPYIVHDLESVTFQVPINQLMLQAGIRTILAVPLRSHGSLLGFLFLSAALAGVFLAEHVQIAQEVADSLAVALNQAELRRDEQLRRQEAVVLRDVTAALAAAGDPRQIFESLLVNLHNLIEYDRAGLFLVDENEQMVRTERGPGGVDNAGLFLDEHPIVEEMRTTRQPVIVPDIQTDPRFDGWPDVESVRGWLGAPLFAGERLVGFISLGALQPNAFSSANQETMRMFTAEISQLLERAWLDEQSRQRSEELEVLSNITFALGQAEGGGDTLAAILAQVARFFAASRGAVLVHDPVRNALIVKACTDPALQEMAHPFQQDELWEALAGGQLRVIPDADELMVLSVSPLLKSLLGSGGSAVILPLSSFSSTFGLLCLVFDTRRRFSSQTISLLHTVAEIAGASLRRAVVLEALEKQVTIRTEHLSTLYRINAAAGELLPFETLLNRVLDTAMEALRGTAACIHLRDIEGKQLELVAQRNVSTKTPVSLLDISLEDPFWRNLVSSTDPVIVPDVMNGEDIPPDLVEVGTYDGPAYIGVPIRAKGELLGVLSLFGETIQNYSIDDITLFTTIADQIGGLVERARLARQAELAAVVQERQRLARELHDSVTQLLYSQILFSGAGLKELRHGNQPMAEGHLARIENAAQQALREMRLLVYELRPSNELDEGLAAALERRLDAVERRSGTVAKLIVNGTTEVDRQISSSLFRIAEEALNNTLKHSGAATVLVVLRFSDHAVSLEVADDGCGFKPEAQAGGGMGLTNMQERAAQIGGEFVLDSAPGQGTRVVVRVEI